MVVDNVIRSLHDKNEQPYAGVNRKIISTEAMLGPIASCVVSGDV